jgi:hypothetical protein
MKPVPAYKFRPGKATTARILVPTFHIGSLFPRFPRVSPSPSDRVGGVEKSTDPGPDPLAGLARDYTGKKARQTAPETFPRKKTRAKGSSAKPAEDFRVPSTSPGVISATELTGDSTGKESYWLGS